MAEHTILCKLEKALNQRDVLAEALRSALAQWQMYADMGEREDGVRLFDEQSAEGDLFRDCQAILVSAAPKANAEGDG